MHISDYDTSRSVIETLGKWFNLDEIVSMETAHKTQKDQIMLAEMA